MIVVILLWQIQLIRIRIYKLSTVCSNQHRKVDTMSSIKNFKAIEKKITSISAEDCVAIAIPVKDTIQEGENLFHWATHDKEMLAGAGLAPEKIDELDAASDALRYAEGVWNHVKSVQSDNSELTEAYELRDKIVHDFSYAYRNNPSLLSAVRSISSGTGHADMIQDLQNLKEIGMEHKEELEAINFDLRILEKAATTADQIADHVGTLYADDTMIDGARLVRDQAYTYLKSLMREVRECGKYVFYKDKTRCGGYVSRYRRRSRRKSKTAEKEENTVGVAA
jgi:hypothetical protein